MAEKLFGLNKTTLIDYPGKVASTIFTRGCNLRCPYCHNPDFVTGAEVPELYSWTEVMDYLKKRSHLLGGVCITGGEPLLHAELPEMIAEVHSTGLAVKIDTNGTLPDRLRNLKADYFAMDLKTSLGQYSELGFTGDDTELGGRITESIRIIRESGKPHHFRTTVVPGFVDIGTVREIISLINGEKQFALQGFRPEVTLDPAFSDIAPPAPALLEEMQQLFTEAGIDCAVRYNG